MKVVYLAGSYRSKFGLLGIVVNIFRAWLVSRRLWGLGYVVLCPHTNALLMSGKIPESLFLDGDIVLLKRCDLVVLLPGWDKSRGTLNEISVSIKNNLPIYLWQNSKLVPISFSSGQV